MITRSKAPRGAFTLIEILVVIGIIALLSAILFPVYSKVRENGRKVVCTSNLKSLGLAFQQYAQDYNRYPGPSTFYGFAVLKDWKSGGNWVKGTDPLAEPSGDFAWKKTTAQVEEGAIFPYAKVASLYYCPSNADGQNKHLSYSMSCALGGISGVRIRKPEEVVLLVDEEYANDGYFYASDDPDGATASPKSGADFPSASTDKLTKKHNGGGNLLFVDGHVDFYPFEQFPLDDSPAGLNNKWKDTGSPRFHDRAFGPYGSGISVGEKKDYCNADKRIP